MLDLLGHKRGEFYPESSRFQGIPSREEFITSEELFQFVLSLLIAEEVSFVFSVLKCN